MIMMPKTIIPGLSLSNPAQAIQAAPANAAVHAAFQAMLFSVAIGILTVPHSPTQQICMEHSLKPHRT